MSSFEFTKDDLFGLMEAESIRRGYVCAVCYGELNIHPIPGGPQVIVACEEHGSVTRSGRVMRSTVSIEYEKAFRRYRDVVKNLSDFWGDFEGKPRSFSRLGHIRKGEKDEEGIPHDLSYFRFTFQSHPKRLEIEAALRKSLGDQPRSIPVRLAFPEPGKCWQVSYECHKQGSLIAKVAIRDQGHLAWEFLRDPETGEILISGGASKSDDGADILFHTVDLARSIYTNMDNEPQFLAPVGRLEVVLPSTAGEAVGYFECRLRSPSDIRRVQEELKSITKQAFLQGRSLLGIPFTLSRIEEPVMDGTSWMVHLKADPGWEKQAQSLPSTSPAQPIPTPPPPSEPMVDIDSLYAMDYAAVEWGTGRKQANDELRRRFMDRQIITKAEFLALFAPPPIGE